MELRFENDFIVYAIDFDTLIWIYIYHKKKFKKQGQIAYHRTQLRLIIVRSNLGVRYKLKAKTNGIWVCIINAI